MDVLLDSLRRALLLPELPGVPADQVGVKVMAFFGIVVPPFFEIVPPIVPVLAGAMRENSAILRRRWFPALIAWAAKV